MKRISIVMFVTVILVVGYGVNESHGQEPLPLNSADLETGLLVLKSLPVCLAFGIPLDQVASVDLDRPELKPWAAFVDQMIFEEQDECYTSLWYGLSVASFFARIGAEKQGIQVLQKVLDSPELARVMQHFSMIYREV